MMLLADSGSTKTHWWLAEDGKFVAGMVTEGLNPFFHTREGLAGRLAERLPEFLKGYRVRSVHFYGAGCSTRGNRQMVRDALKPLLAGEPEISVEKDLLGAARALFGKGPGIACILGTGSNACKYDGTGIASEASSVGFILGDEGSGAHLGKAFLARLLKGQLSPELEQLFARDCGFDRAQILEGIYRNEHPNRFLASFSRFIHQQMHQSGIPELVDECFEAFFREQVCRLPGYQDLSMGCIGSVGYHYRDIIRRIARKHGFGEVRFMASPMEGLLTYHSRI